ncbi:MAG: VWA domain-containing protein [Elusimicrobia bacterium]|nr:VWA domain-containing protein [Elusimicrobiota bacterium]
MDRLKCGSIKTAALPLLLLACAGWARSQELIAWPVGSQASSKPLPLGTTMPPIGRMPMPPQPRDPSRPRPIPFPQPRPTPSDPVVRPGPTPSAESAGYHVRGTIDGQVANLELDIAFHNPTSQRMEGVLLIPIPADTVLNTFEMTVGGQKMKAELLEAGKAAQVYEAIVRQARDPGLLELAGERLVRARVFPIEPNSTIQVAFSMSQMLRSSGGLLSLNVPLRTAQMSNATSSGASVRLQLNAASPIRTLYSSAPGVKIERTDDRHATIEYRTEGQDRTGDLSLFYSVQKDPLAAGLLTFKEEGEDGFFLLSVSPKAEADQKAVPKDVVFVVDRSGSMNDGGKMDQAKAALQYCLSRLDAQDRFGIVDFATDSAQFDAKLVAANAGNKARAKRYINRLEAAGGTNIEAGLHDGLALLSQADGRVPMVFFLTDGLPTAGQTDIPSLLRQAGQKNAALRSRVFAFGVGNDVNTLFLDKLASENRGERDYVAPGENIEHKVSSMYQKVAKPALTDVKIEWKGVEAAQTYPRPVTDLFYGSELVLMGRYADHGKGTLVVTGNAGGKQVRFSFPVDFPAKAERNSFLPRMWANMKVTHELDAVRLSGRADPEIIKDIVTLAKRYGIVTPYTSYLITEEGRNQQVAQDVMRRTAMEMHADAMRSGTSSGGAGGGALAMRAQKASKRMRPAAPADGWSFQSRPAAVRGMDASAPKAMAAPQAERVRFMKDDENEAREELKAQGVATIETRQVGGKTFYLRGDSWIDGQVEATESTTRVRTVSVRYMSAEYFDLLRRTPALGRYFTLGENVTVLHAGTIYKVTKS